MCAATGDFLEYTVGPETIVMRARRPGGLHSLISTVVLHRGQLPTRHAIPDLPTVRIIRDRRDPCGNHCGCYALSQHGRLVDCPRPQRAHRRCPTIAILARSASHVGGFIFVTFIPER